MFHKVEVDFKNASKNQVYSYDFAFKWFRMPRRRSCESPSFIGGRIVTIDYSEIDAKLLRFSNSSNQNRLEEMSLCHNNCF